MQSKGNNSTILNDSLIILLVHNLTMVIIQYEFNDIPSIGYLVMAEDGKKMLKYRQSKDHNSALNRRHCDKTSHA